MVDLILYGSGPALAVIFLAAFIFFNDWQRRPKSAGNLVQSPAFFCSIALLLDALLLDALLLQPPIFGMVVLGLGMGALMLAQALFNPEFFWLSLACVFFIWLSCNWSDHAQTKVVADWTQPLLIGMGTIGAIYLVATLWIPRAQSVWLFRMEEVMRSTHQVLDAILPKALWSRMTILIMILSVDMSLPQLHRWTARFNKVIKGAKKVLATLSVLVSMTLFGHGQTSAIGQKITEEKYARLEEDATAIAELLISARLQKMPQEEAKAASAWLDAIAAGVSADLAVPLHLQDRALLFQSDKSHSESLIRSRVEELRDAIAKHPIVIRATGVVDAGIAGILGRTMTEAQRYDAKAAFEKTLENFVWEGANFVSEPVTELLTKAGTPDRAKDLVKDLYKDEVKRLSRLIAEPLADAIFRPSTSLALVAPASIADAAQRPAFDAASLPREVVRPTPSERVERATRGGLVREVAKKAARKT